MIAESGVNLRLHSWFSRTIVEGDRVKGYSDQCVATYPGDMANALAALAHFARELVEKKSLEVVYDNA